MEQSRRAKVRKPGAQSLPRKETPSLPETGPCAQTLQETPESPAQVQFVTPTKHVLNSEPPTREGTVLAGLRAVHGVNLTVVRLKRKMVIFAHH